MQWNISRWSKTFCRCIVLLLQWEILHSRVHCLDVYVAVVPRSWALWDLWWTWVYVQVSGLCCPEQLSWFGCQSCWVGLVWCSAGIHRYFSGLGLTGISHGTTAPMSWSSRFALWNCNQRQPLLMEYHSYALLLAKWSVFRV